MFSQLKNICKLIFSKDVLTGLLYSYSLYTAKNSPIFSMFFSCIIPVMPTRGFIKSFLQPLPRSVQCLPWMPVRWSCRNPWPWPCPCPNMSIKSWMSGGPSCLYWCSYRWSSARVSLSFALSVSLPHCCSLFFPAPSYHPSSLPVALTALRALG